jgi:hypothetical protein
MFCILRPQFLFEALGILSRQLGIGFGPLRPLLLLLPPLLSSTFRYFLLLVHVASQLFRRRHCQFRLLFLLLNELGEQCFRAFVVLEQINIVLTDSAAVQSSRREASCD